MYEDWDAGDVSARQHGQGDMIERTKLYPTRSNVEQENQARLEALPGPREIYRAVDFAETPVYGE